MNPHGKPTKRDDRSGFTLIELLLVVVIIGILAAIAVPKLDATRNRSFRAAMMSDLRGLAGLQEEYHADNFNYGTDLATLGAQQSDGVTVTVNEASGSGWSATAAHAGLPTQQCGLYYGDAAPSGGDPAVVEGVIACTF